MHDGPKVIRQCRAVPKQPQSDQRVLRHEPLIRHERGESCDAHTQRHQGPPGVPVVHNTAPSNRDQYGGDATNKHDAADPIDARQLLRKALRLVVQVQVQRDQHKAQGAEREIEPEDPPPISFLREGTADDGTRHRPDCPHHRQEAKVLPALAQRDQVGDDDLGQRDDAATADALDGPADEDHGEVVCDAGNNGANREEDEGDEDERLAAENVGKGGKVGLKDGGGEEEGGAGPEGLDCTAMQLLRDDLGIISLAVLSMYRVLEGGRTYR